MSRILAQPIFRDAVLIGKFLGGLLVLGICLVTLWLLMTGLASSCWGFRRAARRCFRGLALPGQFAGLWRRVAGGRIAVLDNVPVARDSALRTLTLWLVFSVFWPMLTPLLANAVAAGRSVRPGYGRRQCPAASDFAFLPEHTLRRDDACLAQFRNTALASCS